MPGSLEDSGSRKEVLYAWSAISVLLNVAIITPYRVNRRYKQVCGTINWQLRHSTAILGGIVASLYDVLLGNRTQDVEIMFQLTPNCSSAFDTFYLDSVTPVKTTTRHQNDV